MRVPCMDCYLRSSQGRWRCSTDPPLDQNCLTLWTSYLKVIRECQSWHQLERRAVGTRKRRLSRLRRRSPRRSTAPEQVAPYLRQLRPVPREANQRTDRGGVRRDGGGTTAHVPVPDQAAWAHARVVRVGRR